VNRQLLKPHRFITAVFLSVFAVTFILMEDYSFAQREKRDGDSSRVSRQQDKRSDDSSRVIRQQDRRGSDSPRVSRKQDKRGSNSPRVTHQRSKRRIISPSVSRQGNVIRKLPRGYRRVWHESRPYFYSGGVFYTQGTYGFIVVRAPIGSIVVSLPVGFRRLWVSDAYYYAYGGTFYRRAPSGFVVVAPPAEVVLEEEAPVLVQPSEAAEGQVSVTASILNVRSGPDLSYPLIYQVHSGYILELHGQSRGWLYVELPNGEFGWVMSEFTYRVKAPGSG
jgi:hypothetical protein